MIAPHRGSSARQRSRATHAPLVCPRAKDYLHGHALPPYKDRYDLSTITPEEQERAAVVRYAVASEYQGVVTLKVAGADSKGAPVVLSDSIVTPLTAYMAMIKDAGVPLRVVLLLEMS